MTDVAACIAGDKSQSSCGYYSHPDTQDGSLIKASSISKNKRVSDIMTNQIHKVSMDASLEEVLDLILEEDIHRVIVTHRSHVVGIVTSGDLLHAFREYLRDDDEDDDDDEFDEDEEDEGEASGEGSSVIHPDGREQILWMRCQPVVDEKWTAKLLRIKGKDYVNEFHGWEEKGCEFFLSCVEALQMGELPDIDILLEDKMRDDSMWGGGRRGKIGRKSPKIKPASLLGVKKP